MPDRQREQVDFELCDDGSAPGWIDRPGGQPAPTLRPDQMLLPVPALDETFVVPRWTSDDVPAGWTFLAAEMDASRLTRLNGRFVFRSDAHSRVIAVWVRWSPDLSGLTATTTSSDTGALPEKALDGDIRRLEESVLRRAERYLDLLSMVGAEAVTPDGQLVTLEAVGIGSTIC